jgi:hypothetical protein
MVIEIVLLHLYSKVPFTTKPKNMKTKAAFTGLLFLISFMSWSQTEKGTFYMSGATSMTFNRNTASVSVNGTPLIESFVEINSFSLQAELGFFIVKDLSLGLVVDHTYAKDFTTSTPVISNQTLLMPGLTYVIPLKSELRPFVQIGGGLATVRQGEGIDEESYLGFVLAGILGAKYFINESVSLDLGVQLSTATVTNEADDITIDIENITGGIGISLYF